MRHAVEWKRKSGKVMQTANWKSYCERYAEVAYIGGVKIFAIQILNTIM